MQIVRFVAMTRNNECNIAILTFCVTQNRYTGRRTRAGRKPASQAYSAGVNKYLFVSLSTYLFIISVYLHYGPACLHPTETDEDPLIPRTEELCGLFVVTSD
jgi:hypothetical protein